jgi:uncharacterized protein YbjT (DUF2867 family)
MKIVVIGGSGLIGSKLVNDLVSHGHEALAASPNTAPYYGAVPAERALVPENAARLGELRFDDWLQRSPASAAHAGR